MWTQQKSTLVSATRFPSCRYVKASPYIHHVISYFSGYPDDSLMHTPCSGQPLVTTPQLRTGLRPFGENHKISLEYFTSAGDYMSPQSIFNSISHLTFCTAAHFSYSPRQSHLKLQVRAPTRKLCQRPEFNLRLSNQAAQRNVIYMFSYHSMITRYTSIVF